MQPTTWDNDLLLAPLLGADDTGRTHPFPATELSQSID
jgi:hypothetical protein